MWVLETVAVAFGMYSALPTPRVDWNGKNMRYALAVFPLVGAALAASQGGLLAEWLGVYDEKTGKTEVDETVAQAIQYPNQSVEGSALRCTVTEALYDPEGGTYSLAWRYEPLKEGDPLYVVCQGPLFDGEWTDSTMGRNDIECFLTVRYSS